jgi:hypothetical protein
MHLRRLLTSCLFVSALCAAEGEAPMKKEGEPAPVAAKTMTEGAETKAAPAEKPSVETEKKPATEGEMKKPESKEGADKETKADDAETVAIAPFRAAKLPVAKESRTFHLAKLNKPLSFETTRELQRLFSVFVTQHVVDAGTGAFSKAPGCMAPIQYTVMQDLGEARYLVKATWPALNGDPLLEGKDSQAVLLLDKPVAAGSSGRCTGLHAGMVALTFTAKYAPLEGRKLTIRREAFLQCTPVDESAAAMQKFVEAINQGAELSVITTEKVPCKTCGGLGFTREAQKGKIEDKRTPCKDCEGLGKIPLATETKFAP